MCTCKCGLWIDDSMHDLPVSRQVGRWIRSSLGCLQNRIMLHYCDLDARPSIAVYDALILFIKCKQTCGVSVRVVNKLFTIPRSEAVFFWMDDSLGVNMFDIAKVASLWHCDEANLKAFLSTRFFYLSEPQGVYHCPLNKVHLWYGRVCHSTSVGGILLGFSPCAMQWHHPH